MVILCNQKYILLFRLANTGVFGHIIISSLKATVYFKGGEKADLSYRRKAGKRKVSMH